MSVSENPTLHINSVGRAVRPKTRRGHAVVLGLSTWAYAATLSSQVRPIKWAFTD
jgi:hypothetical protein